jgi:hypothetical protein
MHFRVFYFFQSSGESVASTAPLEMSAKAIRDQLLCRLHFEDDYIGIMDAGDNLLQILCDPRQDRYWVELPLEEAKASFGRYMVFAEVEGFILGLPRVLGRDRIPGMEYRAW